MFRRIIRGHVPSARDNNPTYSECQTSQLEPNLREILVAYQRGEDVSQYVTMSAAKATAEQQFKNRVGKVDPLTEFEEIVKSEIKKANASVAADKKTRQKKTEQQFTNVDTPSQSE